MSNNRFTPASWLAVFLAAIPGLLLMLSRTDLVQPGNQLIPVLVRLGYLTFLLIAIPLLWVRRQRFPEWALMMAGLLTWMAFYLAGTLLSTLWNASGLSRPFFGDLESWIFLLQLIGSAGLFVFAWRRLRPQRLPLSVWLVTGAIVLVNLVIAKDYIAYWPIQPLSTGIVWFFTVSGFAPIEGLLLISVGLLAVRQHGLKALLVVAGGYTYMLLDSDYYSGPNFHLWVGFTAFALILIGLYLVVMPVTALRARTRPGLALAIFIPFGLFQLARSAVPEFVSQGRLTIPWHSISVLLYLALGWFLYSHVSRTAAGAVEPAGPGQGVPVSSASPASNPASPSKRAMRGSRVE